MRDGIVLKDENTQVTFNQRGFCELVKYLLVELVGIFYEEASQRVGRSLLTAPVDNATEVGLFSHELSYYWAMLIYYGNSYWEKGIPAQPEDLNTIYRNGKSDFEEVSFKRAFCAGIAGECDAEGAF